MTNINDKEALLDVLIQSLLSGADMEELKELFLDDKYCLYEGMPEDQLIIEATEILGEDEVSKFLTQEEITNAKN